MNKRIIPALGNAHNYSYNALPAYHFLCDLQNQNLRNGFSFSWGNMASQFTFLPRVRYENLILHRATWQLKKTDYEELIKISSAKLMQETAVWQAKFNLPNRILIVQGDNELLIDLRHELSVQTFIQEIKNAPNIQLAEFLLEEEKAIVKDENGAVFTNECVAIFTLPKKEISENESIFKQKEEAVKRSFSIGSEWLYFKIYCGASTSDELLCRVIAPLIEELQAKNWISSWFFIRYADPKNHLRLRFHLADQNKIGAVTQAVENALAFAITAKQVWKLQTDTYEREIERYGNKTMELSEALFCLDSGSTLDLLTNLDSFQSDYRWLYGIAAIDALLEAFEFSLEQKTKLLEEMKTNFGKEFGMNKHLRKQLNEKYAKFDTQIKQLFTSTDDENLAFLQNHAKHKGILFESIALNIKGLADENTMNNLLSSYIHMMLNRLFKSKQRMYEMVVYDFAFKNYQTQKYRK